MVQAPQTQQESWLSNWWTSNKGVVLGIPFPAFSLALISYFAGTAIDGKFWKTFVVLLVSFTCIMVGAQIRQRISNILYFVAIVFFLIFIYPMVPIPAPIQETFTIFWKEAVFPLTRSASNISFCNQRFFKEDTAIEKEIDSLSESEFKKQKVAIDARIVTMENQRSECVKKAVGFFSTAGPYVLPGVTILIFFGWLIWWLSGISFGKLVGIIFVCGVLIILGIATVTYISKEPPPKTDSSPPSSITPPSPSPQVTRPFQTGPFVFKDHISQFIWITIGIGFAAFLLRSISFHRGWILGYIITWLMMLLILGTYLYWWNVGIQSTHFSWDLFWIALTELWKRILSFLPSLS